MLTLQFYLSSDEMQQETNRKRALERFIADAGVMLENCGFGAIYPVDSYDAFLLLCMLTPDPLSTYSDLMEAAYCERDAGKGEEAQ